ncbi:hypothetical protein [Streptomyces sp. LN549]|uniref:hypothetical protein n=1 Tax=Streptomyces sp. LN549 TaxID=3112979 RepID=UPI003719CBBB
MRAAISTYCLDISEPKTRRGLLSDYRLYTARWALSDLDLPGARRPAVPDPDRLPPADPGASAPAAPQLPGQRAREWEIPCVPLSYDRASSPARPYGRSCAPPPSPPCGVVAYDVVAHQQAAMPEQLLAPPAADPEDDDQEPEASGHGRGAT